MFGMMGSPLMNPQLMQQLLQMRQAMPQGNLQAQPMMQPAPVSPMPNQAFRPSPMLQQPLGATPARPNMVAPPRRRGFGGLGG